MNTETETNLSTTVAARIAGTRVSVGAAWPPVVSIDGSRVQIEGNPDRPLDGGGKLLIGDRKLFLLWPDESTLTIELEYGSYLNAFFTPAEARRGKLTGLFGNFDGDRDNDLVTSAGDALELPLSFESTYTKLAASWRIAANDSLFE